MSENEHNGKRVDKNMDKVWQLYAQTKDAALREKIILEYAYIVKYVAGRLRIHIGTNVEFEDMISNGIFGLLDAIDKFDYSKGVKFETYASLRIRGAILDSIRKMDWVPRTLRVKNKQLEQAFTELTGTLGREPYDEELAQRLGITVDEVTELIKKSSIASLVSLDEYFEQNHEAALPNADLSQSNNPEAVLELQEAKKLLTEAIEKLSDKEKTVIMAYYYEELTLKEISVVMGVSESRISQIHSKAVFKLKTKLGKYRSILFV